MRRTWYPLAEHPNNTQEMVNINGIWQYMCPGKKWKILFAFGNKYIRERIGKFCMNFDGRKSQESSSQHGI